MSNYRSKPLHTMREDALAAVFSITVNLLLFSGFVAMGYQGEETQEPLEDVQWVSLTALGENMPKALPRIVAPDEAPEPSSKAISVSRVKEEQKPKEKKEKKVEKKKKKTPKKKIKKRKPKKRKPKKGTLASLFARDERADRGKRRGDARGHASGTSSQWQNSTEMTIYLNRVSTLIQRRVRIPATLSRNQLKRLSTTLFIRINSKGKIIGKPKWIKRSGNKFYDNASLRALNPFSSDQGVAKLILPRDKKLRKTVLKKGFNIVLEGKNIR